MSKPAGQCVYCGGGNLTKEHVIAKWVQGIIPPDLVPMHTHQITRNTDTALAKPVPRSFRPVRQGDFLDQTVRAVCATCNNGWLSDLQSECKPAVSPLIVGQWTQLTLEQCQLAAVWFFMLLVAHEAIDPPTAAISPAARAEFMATKLPPNNVKMWMAPHDGVFDRRIEHLGAIIQPDDMQIDVAGNPNAQITTVIIKNLLLHSIGGDNLVDKVRAEYAFENGLLQIWPLPDRAVQPFVIIGPQAAHQIITGFRQNMIAGSTVIGGDVVVIEKPSAPEASPDN